jgi:hypothetical protein
MSDPLQELLGLADQPDQIELTMAHNGLVQSMKAYRAQPGKSTKQDYDAARQLYTEVVERLTTKYLSAPSPDSLADPTGPWKTRAAVLRYLQSAGWQIEKQTFYNHTKPGHRDFKLAADKGYYAKGRVDKYAREWLVRRDTGLKVDEEDGGLLRIKTEEEIKRIKQDIEIKQFKFDTERRKYLARDLLELEIVGRAGVLDSGFNFLIQSKALELVAMVGGDQKRVPEFISFFQAEWNRMLAGFARLDNIETLFEDQ